MNEEELKIFIDAVIHYFEQVTGEKSKMGIPYIKNSDPVVLDCTGVIGISGNKKGCIYFTGTKEIFKEVAATVLGPDLVDDDAIVDIAGEISNTIAGNVRKSFGSSFMISVPIVLKGRPNDIVLRLNPPVYVIPIQWRGHKAFLTVGLE